MIEETIGGIDLRTASTEEMRRLMNLGVADALQAHKNNGVPAVVWDREHDRIVLVPPDEIEIPEDAEIEATAARNGS